MLHRHEPDESLYLCNGTRYTEDERSCSTFEVVEAAVV